MSAFDTADGVLMSLAYSWSAGNPARRLYYNIATTAATVVVAGFVASVYLAGVLTDVAHLRLLEGYAAIADHFELLGYVIVAVFVLTWGGAVLVWRWAALERRLAPGSRTPGVEASGA